MGKNKTPSKDADDEAGLAAAISERFRYERDELLAISRALASERDTRKLLALILTKSREITAADAGSVYVVEEPDADAAKPRGSRGKIRKTGPRQVQLRFMLAQNDSTPVTLEESLLPVDDQSIVGRAVIHGRPINVPDLQALKKPGQNPLGVRHNSSFDDRTGYRACSMLTVPLRSARDEVIGVIQLINRKKDGRARLRIAADFAREVIPFDDRCEELALALAAQAGICLENATLYEEIRDAFEGFVDASVTAIEARDPSTSGHSRRVATLSVALAERVDAITVGPLAKVRFTRDELRQIEYAGVLHDFGKVVVREDVLVKAKKLYDAQRALIRLRFDFIRKSLEYDAIERKIAKPEKSAVLTTLAGMGPMRPPRDPANALRDLEELWQLVLAANEPTIADAQVSERLAILGRQTFLDPRGEIHPWLTPAEIEALRISRGSLTVEERDEIQSHVTHTIEFLNTIPWGRNLRRIPRIAGGHHESLDGNGYPHGLRGEEILIETRVLTISDIFDALTASDRPYKSAVPVGKALDILAGEVKRGRCDPVLFDVFVGTKVYEKVL